MELRANDAVEPRATNRLAHVLRHAEAGLDLEMRHAAKQVHPALEKVVRDREVPVVADERRAKKACVSVVGLVIEAERRAVTTHSYCSHEAVAADELLAVGLAQFHTIVVGVRTAEGVCAVGRATPPRAFLCGGGTHLLCRSPAGHRHFHRRGLRPRLSRRQRQHRHRGRGGTDDHRTECDQPGSRSEECLVRHYGHPTSNRLPGSITVDPLRGDPPARHARYSYLPAGTSCNVNAPRSSDTPKYGESTVTTYAAICG